jgi:hypothetical protein
VFARYGAAVGRRQLSGPRRRRRRRLRRARSRRRRQRGLPREDAAARTAGAAAVCAARAASVPADSTAIDAAVSAAIDAAVNTTRAAGDTAVDAARARGAAAIARVAEVTAAAAVDVDVINAGRSGSELMRFPLWPNRAPGWATEAWENLRAALLAADGGWKVWTDWYAARLTGDAGGQPNEALEIARATVPDEFWEQGPAVVNAEIKRLLAEHAGREAAAFPTSESAFEAERVGRGARTGLRQAVLARPKCLMPCPARGRDLRRDFRQVLARPKRHPPTR